MTKPKPKPKHPILSGRIPPVGSFVSKVDAYCIYCGHLVKAGDGLTHRRKRDWLRWRWVTQHALRCPSGRAKRLVLDEGYDPDAADDKDYDYYATPRDIGIYDYDNLDFDFDFDKY